MIRDCVQGQAQLDTGMVQVHWQVGRARADSEESAEPGKDQSTCLRRCSVRVQPNCPVAAGHVEPECRPGRAAAVQPSESRSDMVTDGGGGHKVSAVT